MFRSIVLSACLAGLCAGIVLTLVQQPTVAPIILAAERYESGALASDELAPQIARPDAGVHGHEASGHTHAGADHGHGDGWAPENGLERTFWSLLTNAGVAIGFSLLLCAVYALLPRITPLGGLLWGLAGFVVFFANPSIGLHPQLPGTLSADLFDRQLWWLLTAFCSAAAVALIAWRRVHWVLGAAAVLLILPHVAGAPQSDVHGGLVPQELSQQFIQATILVNAVFWLALGVFSALTYRRFVFVAPAST